MADFYVYSEEEESDFDVSSESDFDFNSKSEVESLQETVKSLKTGMESLMKSGTGDIGIRCEGKEMRVHSVIVGARYIVKM